MDGETKAIGAEARLDARDRLEIVAALQRDLPSFKWQYEVLADAAELRLPGHRPIRLKGPKRVSAFKRKKREATLYEPATVHAISFILAKGRIARFFDVGAAHGYLSLVAASREGHPPAVDAFEMAAAPFAVMQENLALNPGLQISAHNIGLSDRPLGMVPIWYYKSDLFLKKPARSEYDEGFVRKLKYYLRGDLDRIRLHAAGIVIESIDSFCAAAGHAPGFLKIDVDGYEAKVLPGGQETFAARMPFVLLELHRNELLASFKTDRRSLMNLMFGIGYRALLILGHRRLADVEMVDIDPLRMKRIDRDETELILFY